MDNINKLLESLDNKQYLDDLDNGIIAPEDLNDLIEIELLDLVEVSE